MTEILARFGMIFFPSSAVADIPAVFAQGRWLVGVGVLVVSAVGLFASIVGYLHQATKKPRHEPEFRIIQHEMYCPDCHRLHLVSDYGITRR